MLDLEKIRNGALIGSLGACFIAVGDWLIGYRNPMPAYGKWALVNCSNEIGYARPVLSMMTALIGILLLTYGLVCLVDTITEKGRVKQIYRYSVIFGSLQWLFLHFIFCGLQYIYQYLWDKGYEELANETVSVTCNAFFTVILFSTIFMIVPFGFFLILLLKNGTIFPRWTVSFYMVTFSFLFKIVAKSLGETAIANGFSTASNNMAIAIWLFITWIYLKKYSHQGERRKDRN